MRWLALLLAAALLLYPLFIYFGSRWFEPRYLGLIALGLYLLRLVFIARQVAVRLMILAVSTLLAVTVWWLNSETLLLLVPAFINLLMAIVFGYSLYSPPTIPARVAQRFEGQLTPEIERYTTQVTWVWLAFFCVNGCIALATALWASQEIWLLYNGGIAYGLTGLLFAVEYIYRQLVKAKHHPL